MVRSVIIFCLVHSATEHYFSMLHCSDMYFSCYWIVLQIYVFDNSTVIRAIYAQFVATIIMNILLFCLFYFTAFIFIHFHYYSLRFLLHVLLNLIKVSILNSKILHHWVFINTCSKVNPGWSYVRRRFSHISLSYSNDNQSEELYLLSHGWLTG